jgi:peptidylprolyl isomerase
MRTVPKISLLTAISLFAPAMSAPLHVGAAPAAYATPNDIVHTAPPQDWAAFDPDDLLVIDLERGGQVVIALADAFAPVHIANIRRLARAHWYDGLVIERVQDNYVVQWGDPDGTKPAPAGITHPAPAEYERPSAGLAFNALAYRDTYAGRVGSVAGFPVAEDGDRAWLVHCYGMVGVGRDLNPDTGTGAELYAVIGQPPRALDRNIAVVGRVLSGMDILAALPRGTGDLGFYADPGQRAPIRQVRIASDMPAAERPHFERLRADSPAFAAWSHARANRQDTFFLRPAGALDVCNAEPPVRAQKPPGA